MRRSILGVIAIGSFGSSAITEAQDLGAPYFSQALGGLISNQMAITQASIGRSLMRETRRKTSTSSTFEATRLTSDARAPSFEPSVTARRRHFLAFVAKARVLDPVGADNLAELLDNDPITMMTPELAKFGLRTDNVADAYAVYWVEAWEAVHGFSGASSRETAQAVRKQAANAINATPDFASATSEQKQELAESFLVQALLVGAAKEQARGDPAKLAQVSAAVEQGARASGFDLRAIRLTKDGFVPVE